MVCATRRAEIMAWLVARKFDVYVVGPNAAGDMAVDVCNTIRAVDKEGAVVCVSPDDDERGPLLDAGADLVLKLPEEMIHLRQTIGDMLESPRSDAVH